MCNVKCSTWNNCVEDINIKKNAQRLDEPGCVGQGMGGCREGTVRPSQLRAGFPPA